MVITLIGMSGSGKSSWSKRLAKIGFRRICCDDLIENKLGPILKKQGYKGIKDVACWMGQPFEPFSPKNQAIYLSLEIQVFTEIINRLKKGLSGNWVIDTTGSAVYAGEKICSELNKYSVVAHLETPFGIRKKMFQKYMTNPKPVVWQKLFSKKKNETNWQALRRCYPKLLASREKLYKKYSTVSLPYKTRTRKGFSEKEFMDFLRLP
ncbi:MAG: hypothetical protein HY336_00700 [Candidatus Doudnabacteria bacterium]|nr:hypothetical protein [Candidatus Doudnabacteria bacterium]